LSYFLLRFDFLGVPYFFLACFTHAGRCLFGRFSHALSALASSCARVSGLDDDFPETDPNGPIVFVGDGPKLLTGAAGVVNAWSAP
jgi:hypothetical protein